MNIPRIRIRALMGIVAIVGLVLAVTVSLWRTSEYRRLEWGIYETEAQREFWLAASYPPGHPLREEHVKRALANRLVANRYYFGSRRPWHSLPQASPAQAK